MTISFQSKNIACLFVGIKAERDPLFENLYINAIIGKRPLIHLAPAENSVCNYLNFVYKSYQIDFAAYSAKEIEYLFSVIPVECVFSASGEFFANEFILAIRKLADSKREYRF